MAKPEVDLVMSYYCTEYPHHSPPKCLGEVVEVFVVPLGEIDQEAREYQTEEADVECRDEFLENKDDNIWTKRRRK